MTKNIEIIKRYASNLDSALVLATVSTQSGKYFAEVFGEQLKEFATQAEAIKHVEESLKNFYLSKEPRP